MQSSSQPSTPRRPAPMTPTRCIWSPFAPGSVVIASPFSRGVTVDPFKDELVHVFQARLSPCSVAPTGILCSPLPGTTASIYDVCASERSPLSNYYLSYCPGQLSSPSMTSCLKDRALLGNRDLVYSPPVLTPMPSNYPSTGVPSAKGIASYDLVETGSSTLSTKQILQEATGDVGSAVCSGQMGNYSKNVVLTSMDFPCDDPHTFLGSGYLYPGDYHSQFPDFFHGDADVNSAYPHYELGLRDGCLDEFPDSSTLDTQHTSGDVSFPSLCGSNLSVSTACSSTSHGSGSMASSQGSYIMPTYCRKQPLVDERLRPIPTLPGSTKAAVPASERTFTQAGNINPDTPNPPDFAEATEDDKTNDCYADSDSSMTDCYTIRRKPCTNWAPEEDAALIKVVSTLGTKAWKNVAQLVHRECPHLPERTADQCSQHWLRVLDPSIVKGKWTPEDDRALIEAVKACPPKQWKLIANYVKGRTDIQVRYRMKRLAKSLLKRNILPREKLP